MPPIDHPRFVPVFESAGVGALEPALSIAINGDFRAYPRRLLLWHDTVNYTVKDTVGGVPVLVSYGPSCNSGVVLERRLEGRVLEFGNTGRRRHFDMVRYDTESESWWQQFLGEAPIGELTGKRLKLLPADAAAWRRWPGSCQGALAGEAGTLDRLSREKRVDHAGLVPTREPGRNSIHDRPEIASGREVGGVVVQRRAATGLEDMAHDVSFAFAFGAFVPDRVPHRA